MSTLAGKAGDMVLTRSGDAPARVALIDIARTAALLGMVVFHFTRDLEFFGLLPAGFTLAGGWGLFARLVAGSFIFIAGVSFFFAHERGLRWRPFANRLARIVAAAALVSIATYVAMPQAFVFFGILHSIALASVIGLVLVQQRVVVLLAVAAVALVLPELARAPQFNAAPLLWLGLATEIPATLDYLPILPWLAPFALGLAAGRVGRNHGLWEAAGRLTANCPEAVLAPLAWPGRHSLSIYLLHQPVLIAIIWAVTRALN